MFRCGSESTLGGSRRRNGRSSWKYLRAMRDLENDLGMKHVEGLRDVLGASITSKVCVCSLMPSSHIVRM